LLSPFLIFFTNSLYFINKYYQITQKTIDLIGYLFLVGKKSTFFLPFKKSPMSKIKNIKISPDSHDMLKKHCDKHGLKIYKFLEKLIEDNCKEIKDIYGE
jgi:hypothetical protein